MSVKRPVIPVLLAAFFATSCSQELLNENQLFGPVREGPPDLARVIHDNELRVDFVDKWRRGASAKIIHVGSNIHGKPYYLTLLTENGKTKKITRTDFQYEVAVRSVEVGYYSGGNFVTIEPENAQGNDVRLRLRIILDVPASTELIL